jgi:hypothetical protein
VHAGDKAFHHLLGEKFEMCQVLVTTAVNRYGHSCVSAVKIQRKAPGTKIDK